MSGAPAFLGVDQSLTGRRWIGPPPEQERLAEAIVQGTGLPVALAQVLARRGVPAEDAAQFLAPALRDLLPDPRRLLDMEPAASRLIHALTQRQRIAVFADYDVDGAASAALLVNWLRALGHDATTYVPDRIDEGYGPNVPAMRQLGATHDLIVCVDCGTLSHGPIAAAGCDVIVLDHHLGGEVLPPALAVVNPNRQDEDGTLGHLCAAGVVFLLLVEANRQLRGQGTTGPDLLASLDLVALATVADVAPLVGINRALVRQGLAVMARRARPGLVALADVARLRRAPDAGALGFALGPRINAGGRIGQADLGLRLLLAPDPAAAGPLAARLEELNQQRRETEATVRGAALAQAEARGVGGPLVWAAEAGWHPGVIGITAARLKEAFDRPAMVISLDSGTGKGSARSVPGVDIGAAVQRLQAEGLIEQGGGHPMAAGLTLRENTIPTAMARLGELLARQGAGTGGPQELRIDGLLQPDAATPELAQQLASAGPYGAAAPAPRFVLAHQQVAGIFPLGKSGLRLRLETGAGRIDGFTFDARVVAALVERPAGPVHVAGQVELDDWSVRLTARLRVEDIALA